MTNKTRNLLLIGAGVIVLAIAATALGLPLSDLINATMELAQ